MADNKTFKLIVKKVPLDQEIQYKQPRFPPFGDLHLDLLENPVKLKKNPPKPIFKIQPMPTPTPTPTIPKREKFSQHNNDDDMLKELERAYNESSDIESEVSDGSDDDLFSNDSDSDDSHASKHSDTSHSDSSKKKESENLVEFKEHEPEEDPEEKERIEKETLLHKFEILKRKYSNKVEIPEFTELSDLTLMKRTYDRILRNVSLDGSVETFRKYLYALFMVTEWVCVSLLNLPLGGFTKSQTMSANSYDNLLIELGEKHYSPTGSKFPVEVRLLWAIVMNAGLFYFSKKMFGDVSNDTVTGSDIIGLLFGGSVPGSKPSQQSQPQQQAPSKRGGMRGPTITPHDIEQMTKQN